MRAATTLHVRRYTTGAPGAHGNAATSYAAATDWLVYGLAPGASEEPRESNRDLSEIAWTVYAPDNADAPTEADLVVVDDVDYSVEGRPADWTRGPFGAGNAGIVVELKRAEG